MSSPLRLKGAEDRQGLGAAIAAVERLFDHAFPHGDVAAPTAVVFNAGIQKPIDPLELTPDQFEGFWRVGSSPAKPPPIGYFLAGRGRSCSPKPRPACAGGPTSC